MTHLVVMKGLGGAFSSLRLGRGFRRGGKDQAAEDLGATLPSELFVTMQTYHADSRKLVGFLIGACVSAVAANQYMTDIQLKGIEGKLEGKIGKLDGKIGILDGKISTQIGILDGKISTLEAKIDTHLKDIKQELHAIRKK
jgi:hypothetical protein